MKYLIAAAFGLVFGSFLNVCIYRIPRKGSVAKPRRSYCPHCKHTLSALDNIPVFSYIFLRGKCRYCKGKISPRYMIVELLTAVLFALMVYRSFTIYQGIFPIALEIVRTCLFAALLIVISFIDLEFTIIPNKIVYPGFVAGLLFAIGMTVAQSSKGPILSRLLGAAIGAAIILVIMILGTLVFRKQAMGMGDVKLMAMLGIYLGAWPHIVVILLTASILGSLVGIILILVRGKKMGSAIPFGPFLSIGGLLTLLYGDAIWAAYMRISGL